jgi:hypothetical protein
MKLAWSTNLVVAPHRPHGRPVCLVVPLLQRPVHRSVDRWPTDGKPLVAPQVQQKWTSEEDRLGARLCAPNAHALVRCGQNCSALVDLRHLLHGGLLLSHSCKKIWNIKWHNFYSISSNFLKITSVRKVFIRKMSILGFLKYFRNF